MINDCNDDARYEENARYDSCAYSALDADSEGRNDEALIEATGGANGWDDILADADGAGRVSDDVLDDFVDGNLIGGL